MSAIQQVPRLGVDHATDEFGLSVHVFSFCVAVQSDEGGQLLWFSL